MQSVAETTHVPMPFMHGDAGRAGTGDLPRGTIEPYVTNTDTMYLAGLRESFTRIRAVPILNQHPDRL